MTIAYPVRTSYRYLYDVNGAEVAAVPDSDRPEDRGLATLRALRIAAALNYCAGLTDDQMAEDSASIVREDRDRLLEALRTIVHKASTRPVHVDSCDRKCALVLESALEAARDALAGR